MQPKAKENKVFYSFTTNSTVGRSKRNTNNSVLNLKVILKEKDNKKFETIR